MKAFRHELGHKGPLYTATTRNLRVSVRPEYRDEQSAPRDHYFVWTYCVSIENLGPETVQLVGRHWRVTDARGDMQQARGVGVVGEQPILEPGDSFEYTSCAPLTTPSGIMGGTYQMQNERGEAFDIEIPAFSLDSPYQEILVH